MFIFFPYWPFPAYKMSYFVSLRLFYGCCCREHSPSLRFLPFGRIKFRKKIILMRVRGVGINGWIIFGKRRTSSLRWAVSHSNVLVITRQIMPTKGCLPLLQHMRHLLERPQSKCVRACLRHCTLCVLPSGKLILVPRLLHSMLF